MIQAEKERLVKSDILSIENRVRHAFDQGYDLGYKDGLDIAKTKQETVTEFADRCRECGRERVLDKIRAEIIELRSRQNVGVLECLDILDKYKAEIKSSVYEDKAERKTHSLVFDNEHEYQKFKNVLDTGWEPNF